MVIISQSATGSLVLTARSLRPLTQVSARQLLARWYVCCLNAGQMVFLSKRDKAASIYGPFRSRMPQWTQQKKKKKKTYFSKKWMEVPFWIPLRWNIERCLQQSKQLPDVCYWKNTMKIYSILVSGHVSISCRCLGQEDIKSRHLRRVQAKTSWLKFGIFSLVVADSNQSWG